MEAIEAGLADVVIVGYFDRLVRSLKVQEEVVSRVEAADGEVLAVDYGRISEETAATWLSGTLVGAVHEYQRRSTRERVGAAQVDAIERGVPTFPNLPPGLAKGKDGRMVQTDEAPIALRAFERRDPLRLEGPQTIREIREYLLGEGIERVYPRPPIAVGDGAPLRLVGRLVGDVPEEISIRGTRDGAAFTRTLEVEQVSAVDAGDVQKRWAMSRVAELVDGDAGREALVELGTRFGIVTPWTALVIGGGVGSPYQPVRGFDRDPLETEDVSGDDDECRDTRRAFERWYDASTVPPGAADALLPARPPIAQPLDADFGNEVRLLAVEAPAKAKPGDAVELTWTFEARGKVGPDWKLFVHVKGPGSQPFINGDHKPARSTVAVSALPRGVRVEIDAIATTG